jgi:SAM-dependent methyltransferase
MNKLPPLFADDCLGPDYVVRSFASLPDLRSWSATNPWIFQERMAQQIAENALAKGVTGAWVGEVPPERITCDGPNYRETLLADGLNPRQRAVLDLLTTLNLDPATAALYATEGVTDYARRLAARFQRFVGSEYAPTEAEQKRIAPVVHQDLANLSFPDDCFDVIISNEVFEHLPDLPKSLAELARVTRAGGTLLATFPFLPFVEISLVKARMQPDGEIEYLMEKEFHGNPMIPDGGSLVFQIPAWDIAEMAVTAGFLRSEFVLVSSLRAGITATESPGIFIFAART